VKKFWLVLILIALLALPFIQFKNHLYGIETSLYEDVICYMQERELVKSDSEFFWRVLSLDRVRTHCKNSYYLYRPGFIAIDSLKDIFFRENYYVTGFSSILLHGLTAIFLFFLLFGVTKNKVLSFCGSFFFIFHYSGHPIIQWRYISPYIIGFWLFLFGIKSKNNVFKIILLFLSTLFHESFALCYFFVGAYYLYKKKKDLAVIFFIPWGVYCVINLGDFIYQNPSNLIGNYEHGFTSVQKFLWLIVTTPQNFLIVLGWFIGGYLLPQSLHYKSFIQIPFFIALGMVWIVLWIKNFSKIKSTFNLLLLFFFTSLALSLAVGRIGVGSYSYLASCTYYQYFSVFIFTFWLVGYGYQRYFSLKTPLKIFLGLLIINSLVYGYFRIQKIGLPTLEKETLMAKEILRASNFLDTGYCLNELNDSKFKDNLPSILFYRKSCAVKKGIPINLEDLHRRIQ
jgi:hypothetical protein